jgi:hypothetical protein
VPEDAEPEDKKASKIKDMGLTQTLHLCYNVLNGWSSRDHLKQGCEILTTSRRAQEQQG